MAKIRIKKSTVRHLKYIGLALLIVALAWIVLRLVFPDGRIFSGGPRDADEVREPEKPKEMYGIVYDAFELETDEVKQNQTLSHILGSMGVAPVTIDRIDRMDRAEKNKYKVRDIKAGNPYTAFFSRDTAGHRKLEYFVYEKSRTDYIVISFINDSVSMNLFQKEVTTVRRKETARISSSLWNSMVSNNLPESLSGELENIYGWSINFFRLQPEDEFTVIFDERFIDTVSIGTGRVWGAAFTHGGKTHYAIPFEQAGKVSYWDEKGNSMKKQFLKAPLKYSRISSRFNPNRVHPVYKVVRAHNGVDYAAPTGTPVVAIGDGTVVSRGWDSKGGGNTLKIKHANGYESGYLHLQKFAPNIKVGMHVSQGQLIAYVGSTGVSTGPHLDFRMKKSGKYIDPLKIPSGTSEPVNPANRERFEAIKKRIIDELEGEVADSLKVTSF